jgi:hypothetical protein
MWPSCKLTLPGLGQPPIHHQYQTHGVSHRHHPLRKKNNVLKQAKNEFSDKKKKPVNSKAFGQPLQAKYNKILKKKGINQAAQLGGDLESNGVRRLLCWKWIEWQAQMMRFKTSVKSTSSCFFAGMTTSVALGQNDFI